MCKPCTLLIQKTTKPFSNIFHFSVSHMCPTFKSIMVLTILISKINLPQIGNKKTKSRAIYRENSTFKFTDFTLCHDTYLFNCLSLPFALFIHYLRLALIFCEVSTFI